MAEYIVKNPTIEAVQWSGDKVSEVPEWIKQATKDLVIFRMGAILQITKIDSNGKWEMIANPGDYIIKTENDGIYPMRKDVFEMTYSIKSNF